MVAARLKSRSTFLPTVGRITLRPQPGPQEGFLASPADIAFYGGAAGGGKSWALLFEPLRHIRVPDFGATIFRRTCPEITNQGGLWDESRKLYPLLGAEARVGDMTWQFKTGARIGFSHLQHEDDVQKWQGAQIPLIEFDELTRFTEHQFVYLLSRNRSLCGVRPYMRGSCNPDASSWVARWVEWWIDQSTGLPIPERAGRVRYFVRDGETLRWADSAAELQRGYPGKTPKSFTFIPARLEDNAILQQADPGYRSNLEALPRIERERLLRGNWLVSNVEGEWPGDYFGPGIYFDDWPADCFVKALALDPSKGKDAKFGDYSAFVLAGRTPDGTTWIEADLERRPTPRIVEDGLYLYEQWRPDGFAIEINSFQELLAAEFARVAAERKPAVVLPLYAITNRLPKATRIRSIGPRLAQRKLRFRGGHHGTRLLVEQLMQFPNGDFDDGCFVAGTMIETASGPKPIETVRAGDMVLTRTGFARVTLAGCTGIKPVIEVAASNGKGLIGTGNHPVFDGSAFVPMRSACTLWRCQEDTTNENGRANLSWSSSMGSISGATLMRNSGPTASISPLTPGTVGQALGRFIRKCGSRFTGRYPTASRFITPTMTRSTTISATSNASPKRSTTGGTQLLEANGQRAQQAELVWRKPGSPRHDGTDRKPVEYGTESLGFGHGKAGSQLKCVARTAARLTRHSLPAGLSFAPPAAGSGPTRPMVALRAASVVGRSKAGVAPVYNLTVEGEAEYFANGFLVHNCDALEMALRLLDELLGERERNASGPGRPQIWRAA